MSTSHFSRTTRMNAEVTFEKYLPPDSSGYLRLLHAIDDGYSADTDTYGFFDAEGLMLSVSVNRKILDGQAKYEGFTVHPYH